MNRPTKQNVNPKLPMLHHTPGLKELMHVAQMAQNYPGEIIEQSWLVDPQVYILTAFRGGSGNRGIMTAKKTNTNDTTWTLTSKASLTSHTNHEWTQISSDVEFIENLLSVLPFRAASAAPSEPNPSASPSQDHTHLRHEQNAPQANSNPYLNQLNASAYAQPAATQTNSQSAPQGGNFNQGYAQPSSAQPISQSPAQNSNFNQGFAQPEANTALSGNFKTSDLSGTLRTIIMSRMTGCLEVHDKLDELSLFFDEGLLVHAVYESTLSGATVATGDQVLVELIVRDSGDYDFRNGKRVPERTIRGTFELIFEHAKAIKNYWKEMQANGVDLDSTLQRTQNLNKEQFDALVRRGLSVNQELQTAFYLETANKKTLGDICAKLNLTLTVWVPVLYNLIKLDLLSASSSQNAALADKSAIVIDEIKVNHAKNNIVRIESGMMSYDLFIHFLQLEFERAKKKADHFFSVIVFSIHDMHTREPLSVLSVGKLTDTIESTKDKLDLLAHFREHDFIILSPYSSTNQCVALAEKISAAIKTANLEGIQGKDLQLAFGVASFPQSTSLVTLLGHAESAKNKATEMNSLVSIHN